MPHRSAVRSLSDKSSCASPGDTWRQAIGDPAALDRLFRENAGWFAYLAKRYAPPGFDLDDAAQEARLAVLAGIDRYDPGRFDFHLWSRLAVRQSFLQRLRHETRVKRGGRVVIEGIESLAEWPTPRHLDPSVLAVDRAFLATCFRLAPPSPRQRLAITLYSHGLDIANEARARGLGANCLQAALSRWCAVARYRMGLTSVDPNAKDREGRRERTRARREGRR